MTTRTKTVNPNARQMNLGRGSERERDIHGDERVGQNMQYGIPGMPGIGMGMQQQGAMGMAQPFPGMMGNFVNPQAQYTGGFFPHAAMWGSMYPGFNQGGPWMIPGMGQSEDGKRPKEDKMEVDEPNLQQIPTQIQQSHARGCGMPSSRHTRIVSRGQ